MATGAKEIHQQIVHRPECSVQLDQGTQEVCRLEVELEKDAVCHPFCSTYTARILPKKLLNGLETSELEEKEFVL